MREYVNDLGHSRWQPELPDGRRLYFKQVGPAHFAERWLLPDEAPELNFLRLLRRFKVSAWMDERKQVRYEKKWNFKPAGNRNRVER